MCNRGRAGRKVICLAWGAGGGWGRGMAGAIISVLKSNNSMD